MWPLTGNCVYSYDSDRWKTGCGKCDHPHVHPPIRRDATRVEWKLKAWVYSRSNFTFVSPSSWMTEQVKQSMLNRYPIHQIPYGVDTNVYQPLDPEQCRSVLKIPRGKKVLMFSAIDVDDWRKGGDLLVRALQILPGSLKAELVLLTLGNKSERLADEVGIQALALGYVSSDRLKAILYSAADIFVLPTRADNLPLTIMESLGCGTPVVSFKVGGVPELVRSGITGYLAEPENEIELSEVILRLLEDESLRTHMSQQCRLICVEKYNEELTTRRYAELYQQLQRNSTG
jgi:glycosyltransferase involved in cell wall biosynthesis